jgi:hypothetical protein
MGITQVIDSFYQSFDLEALQNRPIVGQFCWIAAPHIDKIPRIMEVARENDTEHYATRFTIRNLTDQDFRKKQKLPIMRWEPTNIALSGEALGVLVGMLREYFGAPQDGDLNALREIVQEALPEEAKISQK